MPAYENNEKSPTDRDMRETLKDLEKKKSALVLRIDQMENKGLGVNCFSPVGRYKAELEDITILLKAIRSLFIQ